MSEVMYQTFDTLGIAYPEEDLSMMEYSENFDPLTLEEARDLYNWSNSGTMKGYEAGWMDTVATGITWPFRNQETSEINLFYR